MHKTPPPPHTHTPLNHKLSVSVTNEAFCCDSGCLQARHGPVPTAFPHSRSPNYGAQHHPERVWELLGSSDYLLRGQRNSVRQE